MSSIGPAGWSDEGFFGIAVKTFGNPMGASKGGGAWTDASTDPLIGKARRDGGANINGPNQGGGGTVGTAWTAQTIATTATKFASNVCAGGGAAVLVDGNGLVWRSTDGGVVWVATTTTLATAGLSIGYADGVFMVVGAGGAGHRSLDGGMTWAATPTTHASGPPTLASDGVGNWIALDIGAASFVGGESANNGATWGVLTSAGAGSFQVSAIYDGTEYVATGVAQPSTNSVIGTLTSISASWTFTTISPTSVVFKNTLVFETSVYWVPTSAGVRHASTPAGLATSSDTNVGLTGLQCMLGGNGLLWVFDDSGNVVGSSNGITWHEVALNFLPADFPGAVFQAYDAVNHAFIAIGSVGLSISTHTDSEL